MQEDLGSPLFFSQSSREIAGLQLAPIWQNLGCGNSMVVVQEKSSEVQSTVAMGKKTFLYIIFKIL